MNDKFFRKGPINSAKNKPTLPSDAELTDAPASDERKTVILDEDLEGVELEDRMWLYWKRNRNFIITTLVIAFALVIGIQSWKMYKSHASQAIENAYLEAQNPQQLEDFAKANGGTTLAGIALLQNADAAFKAGKFADAEKFYNQAADDLGSTILAARAKIGAAMSVLSSGGANKASDMLEKVYKSDASEFSAQAGYLLALVKVQSGKKADAESLLKEIAGNAKNGAFAALANQELSNLK